MEIILHGGAGGVPDEPEPRQAVLDDAVEHGAAQETPLDAVVSALCVLEESPMFNAGVGGAIQSDGQVRTDAGIMLSDLEIGAVASVPGVSEATRAARVIMEETPHVLVRGEFAAEVAAGFGIDTNVTLTTEDGLEEFEELDPPDGDAFEQLEWVNEVFGGAGTVGAVARSGDELAAATSTGGLSYAIAGRVGDVPQAGSGFYCTDAGGVSVTGTGEDIIRTTLSQRTAGLLEDGESAQSAAETALEEFVDLTDSTAGIIVLDADGDTGITFNSDAMQTSQSTEE
ncbi:isoaspartyl peptidase/L-asparaginase [Halalkalicoccus tibetensis]|uniref:Plant-type L-asparaginase n=1 Tax=Halalkalicoccus tibetensis TaxID=175632 RepID=A0ABD5VC03_9EURY